MKNIKFLLSIILNCLLLGLVFFSIYKQEQYIPPTKEQYQSLVENLKYSNKFIFEPKIEESYFDSFDPDSIKPELHGWIPSWAMDSGIKTLESNKNLFASVSPVFYELAEGGLINVNKNGLEKLRKVLEDSNTKIIPTISSFNADYFTTILSDNDKLSRHIEFLLKEIDSEKFDGIDLNYEAIYLKDKKAYFKLINKLSTELKDRKKTFSITVLSKWGDNIKYGFAPETREVMDYTELSKYADQLRIMTYDFTGSGSTLPGPIAPEKWVRQVLDYTVKRVPREKIILGTHLYGYVWTPGNAAQAYDYRQIRELVLKNESVDVMLSNSNQEPSIKFVSNGILNFGYFADKEFVERRIDLAREYGINGLTFWRLGNSPI